LFLYPTEGGVEDLGKHFQQAKFDNTFLLTSHQKQSERFCRPLSNIYSRVHFIIRYLTPID